MVAVPEEAGLRVVATAGVTSAGVRRGAVVDMPAAAAAMGAAMQRVRRLCAQPLVSVLLGSAAGQILCFNGYAETVMAMPGSEITAQDVVGVLDQVRRMELPPGYHLAHAIPQGFVVDGYEGCRDPVGMAGQHLAVRAHLVACQGAVLQNLLKAAADAAIDVEDFAVAGLAAAESVLTPEERREGVLLIDLGAGATQVVAVLGGEPVLTATVPLGGEHVTADIAAGLRLTRGQAEALKWRHASADLQSVPAGRVVDLDGLPPKELPGAVVHRAAESAESAGPAAAGNAGAGASASPPARVDERDLAEITAARVEEIMQQVADMLGQGGKRLHLAAGAVLTGGGSRLRGIQAVGWRGLGMPVRCGGAIGATEALGAPECAAAVGLLQMQAQRLTGHGGRLLTTEVGARRLWPPWRLLSARG